MKKDNLTAVLTKFIRELDIKVSRQSVSDELYKHPDYYSLFAISDLLNNWSVPNVAYELTFEELSAIELSFPIIAYSSNEAFILIHDLNEAWAVVSNERWNKKKIKIDEFKVIYGGIILIAEKDEASGEADYEKKRRKEIVNDLRKPFVIGGVCLITAIFFILYSNYLVSFNWQIGLLTLLKTIGIATASLLLVQSIDVNNSLIQKLCGTNKDKNCNALLSSKAAKITDELSWSEVGFFYFGGTGIVLFLNAADNNLLQVLAILNLLSLPYTIYSVYYQWRVAKQWCVLCCAVQALLWLECFALIPYLSQGIPSLDLKEWGSLFMGMAIPVVLWTFMKPYLLQAREASFLKRELLKFKYNSNLFEALLNEGVKYTLPDEEHSLIVGNREAEHIITLVSNPYCEPCSKAHKVFDDWLEKRDNIKLQVIFAIDGSQTNIASDLMSLQMQDDLSIKHALNDWYEHRDHDAWIKIHPVIKNETVKQSLHIQNEWCKTAEITGTPTIFINGRRLPENYHPKDIKYLI